VIINYDLHIPPHFFNSARKANGFESPSERIAKAIVSKLHGTSAGSVVRGDDKKGEPDYIINNCGYEVTFGIANDVIQKLNGSKPLDREKIKIESTLIQAIQAVIEKKADKMYIIPTILVVFCIQPYPVWCSGVPPSTDKDIGDMTLDEYGGYLVSKFWLNAQKVRNMFFSQLYQEYIESKTFKDIYILQLTINESYVLYSIKEFARSNGQHFLRVINFSDRLRLPFCKVNNTIDNGDFSVLECRCTIIRG